MSKSLENENDEVVTSLETAAHEAAMADGLIPTDGTDSKLKKAGLRRGKWTAEEESYANRLIYEFKLGLLPLTDGTTLRTFLSKLLNCDPMRISKKFVGQNCIGKQVFRRRQQDLEKLTPDQIETSRKELAELERKFLERVAQTNRTKTTGVKVVKDGRADDDNGSTSVAPWMVPPDDKSTGNDSSHRSSGPTPNPNSSSSYSNKEAPYNSNPSFPPNPATAANRMIGYGVGPDMLTVDYQHVISANNALMNQLYQGAQFPYMPNYPMPPPGYLRPDYHLGNGIPPPGVKPDPMGLHYPPPHPSYDPYYGMDALNRMHLPAPLLDANGQFRNDLAAAFPWSQQGPTPQPINPHDLLSNQNHSHNNNSNSSSSGNGNGNSSNSNSNNNNSHNNNSNSSTGHIDSISSNGLAHYPSGSEWNLQSLLGAGESMENIVQFLSQYQATSQSFENLQGAGVAALHNNAATTNNGSSIGNGIYVKKEGESSKDVMMSDHHLDKSDSVGHLSKKNPADDIGYPLDDGIVSTTNSSVTAANSTPANGLGRSQKSSPPQKNDASSLATKSGDSKGKDEMNGYIIPSDTMASMAPMYQRNAANSFMAPAPPIAGQGMSDPVQAAFGVQPAPASGNLPRNSSIENFWMLVRMGDLPRPDQDVLSETIWEAHQQGGTTAKNGVAPNTAKPENPGKSSEISSNTAVKSAPSIPSSSLGLGRIKEEPGRPSYPQPPPAAGRIVPPIMVNTPTPNWPPAESRKRNEEAMSDRSSNSYGNPVGTKSSPPDGVNYAKKVKLEKE